MVASNERRKASQSGKTGSSVSSPGKGSVIAKVASFLKRQPKPRFAISLPKGRSFGKFFYTVQSPIEPVTFTKKKDAEAFSKLLRASTAEYESDIVRREITDDGFYV